MLSLMYRCAFVRTVLVLRLFGAQLGVQCKIPMPALTAAHAWKAQATTSIDTHWRLAGEVPGALLLKLPASKSQALTAAPLFSTLSAFQRLLR